MEKINIENEVRQKYDEIRPLLAYADKYETFSTIANYFFYLGRADALQEALQNLKR